MKIKIILSLLSIFVTLSIKAQELRGYKQYPNDCYSGNCENGFGVMRYFQFEQADASPYRADSQYTVNFYYFEGNFKDGKIINGDAYVAYGYTKKLHYSKSENLEEITLKGKAPEFDEVKQQQKPFYSGEFKHQRRNIQLHGKGKFHSFNLLYEGSFNNNAFVEGIIKPLASQAEWKDYDKQLEGSFTHIPRKIENYVERMRTTYYQGMLPNTSGLNQTNLRLIAGKIIYANGDIFMGNTVDQFKKNGPGIYYNKEKGSSTIGIWQADELLRDVPDVAMENAKVKDTTMYTIKITYADDPYFSKNPTQLIYKGQLQNQQPHGWGVMTNANADSEGITFYYAGFFNNGKKDGTGYQYKDQTYISTLYRNGALLYVSEYTALIRGVTTYTGNIKNGKYHGSGLLTQLKADDDKDKEKSYRTVYDGTFVDGKFTGENLVSGYTYFKQDDYVQRGYFEDGKLINGEKKFGISGLKVGDVINYKGQKVAITNKTNQNNTITMTLSNGEKTFYGLYSLFNESGQNFKETCATCKGTGKGVSKQKMVSVGTTTKSVSYTNATSIRGGYYTITTNYHPIYETIPTKCEGCNGTGQTYKKMVLSASSGNYVGSAKPIAPKKEKTAQEAYEDARKSFGPMAIFGFMEAGEKGHALGAYTAAYMMENQKGISYSSNQEAVNKAIEWYKKAATLGSEDAKKALQRLNVKP